LRFIACYDIDPEDFGKVIETDRERESSGRRVKTLLPPHFIADASKGFTGFVIFESEDDSDIAQYVMEYSISGKKNVRIYPIWESDKAFEIWEKLKK